MFDYNQLNKLKDKIQSSDGLQIKDRTYLYKTYRSVFVGYECVDWIFGNCPDIKTREDAIKLGQTLFDAGIICNVTSGADPIFKDDYIFYQFDNNKNNNINNNINNNNNNNATSTATTATAPVAPVSTKIGSIGKSSSKSSTAVDKMNNNNNNSNNSNSGNNNNNNSSRRTSSVPPPVLVTASLSSSTSSSSSTTSSSLASSTNTNSNSNSNSTYNSNSFNKKHHRYSINELSKVVLEDLNTVTLVKDELIQLSQELMNGDKGLKLQKKKKGAAGTTISCFSGSQLIDWLVKKLEVTRKESIQIASALMHLNIFIEVGTIFNSSNNNNNNNNGGGVMSSTLSTTIPSSISLQQLSNQSQSQSQSNSSSSILNLSFTAPISISSTTATMSSSLSLSTTATSSSSSSLLNSSSSGSGFLVPTLPASVLNSSSNSNNQLYSSSPLSLSTSSIPAFDNRIVEDCGNVFYEFLTKPEAIINHVAMKRLDDLCLTHKCISIIPTTIINTSKFLRIIDLSFNQLSESNQLESIATLYNLESCNLSHNQLSTLPSSFSRLELLAKLILSHNCFQVIPNVVFQLSNLEELSLAANQLSSISESIGSLKSLERLDLSFNKQINKIPKELGLLVRLKSLNVLGSNKINELPSFLSTLPLLEQLDFSRDTIKSPPKEITSKGFTHIIGYLKDLFEGTETLSHIKLMVLGSEKTGRSSLVKALTKSQTKSLSRQSANFLKKVTSSEVSLNDPIEIIQLKLDLPPEQQNGIMTSSSNLNLSTGTLPPPPSTTQLSSSSSSSTSISELKPQRKDSFGSSMTTPEKKRPTKRNVKLMIYDFRMPSIDVYYHTHQFFLSERAFYLVTYDINKDLSHSGLEFWVESIKKKAPNAPIYIVATHIDTFNQYGGDILVPLNEIDQYLTQRSLEVTGVIGVSSTTLRNIDLLKNEIIQTLLNQSNNNNNNGYNNNNNNNNNYNNKQINSISTTNWLNERIPSIYITLETNLQEEAKKRPIVTWDEYQNIAKLSNFTTSSYEKLVRATNTLNRWGSIIWFEDSKSSLKDFVILDPQWFSDCFYKLLLAKHSFINSDGILLLSNLKNIWKPNIVPEQFHIKLLKLLERYQILYTLKNNSNLQQQLQQQQQKSFGNLSKENSLNSMSYSIESRSSSSPLPTVVTLSAEISSSPSLSLSNSSQSAFTNPNNKSEQQQQQQPQPISTSPKLLRNSLKNLKSIENNSSSLSNNSILNSNSNSSGNLLQNGTYISFNRIIIPCLLPNGKPSHLASLWDTWSGEDEHQIGRYYQFRNISAKNCFERVMVRFLYMMEPIVYWSTGILFRKTQTYRENIKDSMSSCGTLVEFDTVTQQLQIRVRGHEFDACAKLFQIVLENVDTILKDYQINQSQTYIPCSCSCECRDLPHLFPIDLIEETFGKGESHTKCPITMKLVSLCKISPDITLSSVSSNKKVSKEDLIYQEEIGVGGFSRVYKGIYKNNTVAIKQFNFERMDLIDSTSFNNLNSLTISPSNSSLSISLSSSTSSLSPPIVNNNNNNNNNLNNLNNLNNNNKLYIQQQQQQTQQTQQNQQQQNQQQQQPKILQRNLSTSSLSSNSSQGEDSMSQISSGKLNAINEFRREVWLMSGLSHSNIVLMKGFCFEPYAIVMEYMDIGSLSSFLKKKKEDGQVLDWQMLLKIVTDIASGMAFLHNITPPLVHRDLKSPNILLASHPTNPNEISAKVSDFGLSRSIVQNFSSKVVDNPTWQSPEVLKGTEYNEKSDIYSFGMILWECYHLELPFDEFDFKFMSTLEDNILSGLRPSINQNCNRMYSSLITKCWNADPNLRPSFNSILKTLNEIKDSTINSK
ncbi:hypothetical protein ACTFIW_013020 [Dictyostelium discoideum]